MDFVSEEVVVASRKNTGRQNMRGWIVVACGALFYVAQWDRVNTLAFRRTLEYIVCHGLPSRST